uniref:Uncharacterized protein n=1 Tax=Oryza barthii TaxID=65489 RepID=A0A0D3GCM8_9ORYZ
MGTLGGGEEGKEEKGLPFSPEEESGDGASRRRRRHGGARSWSPLLRERASGGSGEENFLTSRGQVPFPGVSPRIRPENPCLVGFQMDQK